MDQFKSVQKITTCVDGFFFCLYYINLLFIRFFFIGCTEFKLVIRILRCQCVLKTKFTVAQFLGIVEFRILEL